MSKDNPGQLKDVLFCWGSTSRGQLGLGGIEEEQILVPRQMKLPENTVPKNLACGNMHTLFDLEGIYCCGNNDYGQLGHDKSRSKPMLVEPLANQTYLDLQCGLNHSMVLTDTGQVFMWGSNHQGQLGSGDADLTHCQRPKLVKTLSPFVIVQIASGYNHCLALSNYGVIYSWGDNSHGQLGLGSRQIKTASTPQEITSLRGISLHEISAGANHSMALTVSGALFAWGQNRFGQLGLGDDTLDHLYPMLVKTLRSHGLRHVACGEDHTAVLTMDGGVFTFGAGMYGQLGHNSTNNEFLPKKVFELMGSVVTQIACGRCHTVAFVASSGRLYSFGLGGNGQLGVGGNRSNRTSPTMVKGPFVPCDGPTPSSMPVNMDNHNPFAIKHIFAGGDCCFVLASTEPSSATCDDFRAEKPVHQRVATLNEDRMREYSSVPGRRNPSAELLEDLEQVFSSLSCHNGSFLQKDRAHYNCSVRLHGVDCDEAVEFYARLAKLPNQYITKTIVTCIEKHIIPSLSASPPDVEALRIYMTLPWCHAFEQGHHFDTLICPFARTVNKLAAVPSKIIGKWWAQLQGDQFQRLVNIYKDTVMHILRLPPATNTTEVVARERNMLTCLEFLKKLNTVNETKEPGSGNVLHVEAFYIPELHEKIDIRMDYISWIKNSLHSRSETLEFCRYPFVFDARAKTLLLQTDAMLQMQFAVEEVTRRNMSSFFLPQIDTVSPCLILYITRTNIVQDTLNQIQKAIQLDLKKPLKVTFVNEEAIDGGGVKKVIFIGEEAIDEGGVRKEFFQLLLRELLDPKWGMFHYYEESRQLWFHEQSFEDNIMFMLVGVLCGLAIYNATIIDLHFPLALYRKLLKKPVTLDDLLELDPCVARSLSDLLQHEADDIADVFCLTFEGATSDRDGSIDCILNLRYGKKIVYIQKKDNLLHQGKSLVKISREVFGEVKLIPLVENGAQITVNKENRQSYVDAYIDYVFNKSVREQFKAFSDGFHRVCGGRVLELFHPQELQAMVIGNENYDWELFEQNAEYKGEFHVNHPTIKNFWEVFRELSHEKKKQFLLFLTGSDRIPIHGMKAVKCYIQSTGGGEQFLPVAHTCFNLLDLPIYTNIDILRDKLIQAVENTEGFGLV